MSIRDPNRRSADVRHHARAGAALDLEEALRRSSRSISSKLIDRIGIQSIRVLSESRFMALVSELVEARLREDPELVRCARQSIPGDHAPAAGELDPAPGIEPDLPVDDDGLPIVIIDDFDQVEEELAPEWREHGRSIAGRLGISAERIEALGERLGRLGSLVERVTTLRDLLPGDPPPAR